MVVVSNGFLVILHLGVVFRDQQADGSGSAQWLAGGGGGGSSGCDLNRTTRLSEVRTLADGNFLNCQYD